MNFQWYLFFSFSFFFLQWLCHVRFFSSQCIREKKNSLKPVGTLQCLVILILLWPRWGSPLDWEISINYHPVIGTSQWAISFYIAFNCDGWLSDIPHLVPLEGSLRGIFPCPLNLLGFLNTLLHPCFVATVPEFCEDHSSCFVCWNLRPWFRFYTVYEFSSVILHVAYDFHNFQSFSSSWYSLLPRPIVFNHEQETEFRYFIFSWQSPKGPMNFSLFAILGHIWFSKALWEPELFSNVAVEFESWFSDNGPAYLINQGARATSVWGQNARSYPYPKFSW